MNNEIIIPELNREKIESMIYVIRGVKVMLDFDLAKIYGYETKSFNQQVKRNINKFPDRYRFQLTKAEIENLVRSQNVTSQDSWHSNEGGSKYLPYAFTEQGIYMLMTVLKGELATKQSIILIDSFKQMKDYIIESNNLSSTNELLKLTNKVSALEISKYNTDKSIEKLNKDNKKIKKKLEIVMDNFIDPSKFKHYLILDGERIEAIIAYQTIYSLAKKSIYIIDDYIDVKTLQLLKVCKEN
ncbi:MAG: ORF6N domain-containing protein, partial [bacterium]|nr:ORF6N domain-containing protein [bacterium]